MSIKTKNQGVTVYYVICESIHRVVYKTTIQGEALDYLSRYNRAK